jgi:hypothetical protein
MRVEFFIDPASGWTGWIPQWPAEAGPSPDKERTAAPRRPAGQSLVVRLLGRVGARFGGCEQTSSGTWRRIRPAHRSSSQPAARGNHSSVWSWWC